ncbi:MAG: hypothetical protein P9X27_04110 [Candidatus Kaelpia aquatica]|nr:hypothetical protein [Candidatus Kaelpia aquatica]
MFNFRVDKQFAIIVFYILSGILVAVALYLLLIIKTTNNVEDYNNRIDIASGENKRKVMMLQAISEFNKADLEIEAKTLKFSDYIPHKVATTEFVKLLDSFSSEFGSKYGLRDMRIDILPLTEIEKGYYQRQFRVYCRGRYMDLMKFFDILQRAKYLINIEELNVRRNPEIIPYLDVDLRIAIIQVSEEE